MHSVTATDNTVVVAQYSGVLRVLHCRIESVRCSNEKPKDATFRSFNHSANQMGSLEIQCTAMETNLRTYVEYRTEYGTVNGTVVDTPDASIPIRDPMHLGSGTSHFAAPYPLLECTQNRSESFLLLLLP